MATQKQEQEFRNLAKYIDKQLKRIYGERMGFFICVSPFNNDNAIADYLSNSERQTAIEWMKETVNRLENKQDIPSTNERMQ